MKNIITVLSSRRIRCAALIGLVTSLAAPAASAASPASLDVPTPIAAEDDDPPCEENVVALQIDVANGLVYIVDATGGLTLTDNDLNIYFGSLSRVVVDLEFTSSDWEVEVSPTGETTQLYYTRGGALRFSITDDPAEYVLSFTELGGGAAAMMNMAPILPDVILQPDTNCPPPT